MPSECRAACDGLSGLHAAVSRNGLLPVCQLKARWLDGAVSASMWPLRRQRVAAAHMMADRSRIWSLGIKTLLFCIAFNAALPMFLYSTCSLPRQQVASGGVRFRHRGEENCVCKQSLVHSPYGTMQLAVQTGQHWLSGSAVSSNQRQTINSKQAACTAASATTRGGGGGGGIFIWLSMAATPLPKFLLKR